MRFKNMLWILMMTIFIVFAYLLFDRGFNVKTKVFVNYQEKSDVIYKVYLHDNDIYDKDYLNMNERYINKLVDNIETSFKYSCLYDKDISGYYDYRVLGKVVAYQENDILWEKEDIILNNKVIVLDKNDFRNIDIENDNNKIGNYSGFSNREDINYLLLVIGAICLALGISFLALVIRGIVINYNNKSSYEREFKKILKNYEDILVSVKRFYNKKKYNLIYLDSFDELLEEKKKIGNPISYREVKKDREAIFIMTNDENAWIYILGNK